MSRKYKLFIDIDTNDKIDFLTLSKTRKLFKSIFDGLELKDAKFSNAVLLDISFDDKCISINEALRR